MGRRRNSEWATAISTLYLCSSLFLFITRISALNAPHYALVHNETEGIIVEYNSIESTDENTILVNKNDDDYIVPEGYQLVIEDVGSKKVAYEKASEILESDIIYYFDDVKGVKYAIVYNEEDAFIIEYESIDQNTIYLKNGKTFDVKEGYNIQTLENVSEERAYAEASSLSQHVTLYDDIMEKNYAIMYNKKEAIVISYHHVETKGTITRIYVDEKQYFTLSGKYSIALCGQIDKESARKIALTYVNEDQVSFYGDEGVKEFKLHK